MRRRIGLNLMRPVLNNYLNSNETNNTNQNISNNANNNVQQFRGNILNGLISRVVNAKPGCSSCGR